MGKVAIITGASSGIGFSLARALSDRGLTTIGIGRNKERLNALKGERANIHIIESDLSEPNGRNKVFSEINSYYNHIDYLIHCAAAIEPIKAIIEIDLTEWRKHYAINVEAPLFLTKKIVPMMQKGSRILFIASDFQSGTNFKYLSPYCTSKLALNSLVEGLKIELSELEIHVGNVLPGPVDTPLYHSFWKSEVLPVEKKLLNWLLIDMYDNEKYVSTKWDIRNTEHYDSWQKSLNHKSELCNKSLDECSINDFENYFINRQKIEKSEASQSFFDTSNVGPGFGF